MTFVAPNLACGEARGGSIPRQWGCDRRATKPQANFNATRRAAVLFRADFVARSLQIHFGICSSLAPRLREKSLAAIVKPILLQHTRLLRRNKAASGKRCFGLDPANARHPISLIPYQ